MQYFKTGRKATDNQSINQSLKPGVQYFDLFVSFGEEGLRFHLLITFVRIILINDSYKEYIQ